MKSSKEQKIIFSASFLSACGGGLNIAGFALFFVVARGFTPAEVGLGLGIAGLTGFFLIVPFSSPADILGYRNHYVLLACVYGTVVIALSFATSWLVFVLLASLQSALRYSSTTVLQTLVGSVTVAEYRTMTMAKIRVIRNVGFAIGAVVASQILVTDSIGVQQLLVAIPGLFLILSVPFLLLLPNYKASTSVKKGNFLVQLANNIRNINDRRYIVVACLNAPLLFHVSLLSFGLPLMLEEHTDAPRWLAPGFLLANTVLVICFQTLLARSGGSLQGALRLLNLCSIALSLTFLLLVLTPIFESVYWQITMLVLCVVSLTFSEMWHSTAHWDLSYILSPPSNRTAYIGVFNMGSSAMEAIGAPTLGFLITNPRIEYATLVALFILCCSALMSLIIKKMPVYET